MKKTEKSFIPRDVSSARQVKVFEKASDRGYFFLEEGGGVTVGDSPRGRFVYGFNGFTLWCQADGYIYASDGLHQLFPVTKEGAEPTITFFLKVGDKVISLLPVPFLGDGAHRYTVSSLHASYFFTEWKDVATVVRVTVSPENQLLFSMFLSFDRPRQNARLFSYFAPYEKTELNRSDEDRWFLTTQMGGKAKRLGSSGLQLPSGVVSVFEDPDRYTSFTHSSLLRGSCHWTRGLDFQDFQVTTSRREFVGGQNRNLNHPVVFERDGFPEQRAETVFNDQGIFANGLFFNADAKSTLRLDYVYERVAPPSLSKRSGQLVTFDRMDRTVAKVKKATSRYLLSLTLEGKMDPDRSVIRREDFFSFVKNLQHQVAVCSQLKGYMQVARRSLVGIRDVFQALEGFLYFAPEKAKEKILEGLAYTCLSGRCLRQYLPGSTIADTREFIDQGLWVIKTLVEYIKVTGDTSILSKEVGYHKIVDDNPYIGSVQPLKKTETVLQHLVRIMKYLVGNINSKSGLLMALYGDWNDALDGLGFTHKKGKPFGTGTTVMGSLQLYQNCRDMIDLLNFLGLETRHKVEKVRYEKARDKLFEGLLNNAIVGSKRKRRILHGFGDEEKYTVGGIHDPDGVSRYSLTSHAFWIISGLHSVAKEKENLDMVPSILSAYKELDDKYGLKTFHPPFKRGTEHWFGRIPRLPAGTAENGATYNHATLFGIWSLFEAGQSATAWAQLEKLLPFTPNHGNYNLTPFVIPNSYIHNPEKGLDGESMNDWQTGSSNVLLKILIWYVFGFRPEWNLLRIQPDPSSPLVQFNYRGMYQGKQIQIEYRKSAEIECRTATLNGKPLQPFQVEGLNMQVVDIPRRKLKKNNRIEITDPFPAGPNHE